MVDEIKSSLKNLPLTNWIANQYGSALKDCVILHINHTLKDVFAINDILVNKIGCELFFIGVPYAMNKYPFPVGYYSLYSIRDGVDYLPYLNGKRLNDCSVERDMMSTLRVQIEYTLQKHILPKLGNKKFLVIQDGGYTTLLGGYKNVPDPFCKIKNLIGMIEQTQSGTNLFLRKEKSKPLNYPVLTISRSEIKTRYESQFVAQRVFEELNDLFYRLGEFVRFKTVVVGGYGVIGRQLAFYLKGIDVEVIVYELDDRVRRLARKEGFSSVDKITSELINESFCYVGCTGERSFAIESFKEFLLSRKKIYYLASGSSKRIEFLPIIQFFEGNQDDLEKKEIIKKYPFLIEVNSIKVRRNSSGLEYHCVYRNKRKTLYLLAEGMPVNFYNQDSESIPERAIDPVQALILLSACKLVFYSGKLKEGINYVGTEHIDKFLGINEEELMQAWSKKNGIDFVTENIFGKFLQHPLRGLLMNRRKKHEGA